MKRVVLIGALIIEIALALILFPRTDRATLQSTDFVNFYGAASLVRQGQGALLYRRETQDPVLQSILGHKSNQYFLHPPFEAAALVPLAYLKIVVPLLLLWRKFRLVAGLVGGGALLVFVSVLITGTRGLIEYVRFVRTFDLHSGYGGLNPSLMANWRGFLAGIGQANRSQAY